MRPDPENLTWSGTDPIEDVPYFVEKLFFFLFLFITSTALAFKLTYTEMPIRILF
jgi:hypothetical protein